MEVTVAEVVSSAAEAVAGASIAQSANAAAGYSMLHLIAFLAMRRAQDRRGARMLKDFPLKTRAGIERSEEQRMFTHTHAHTHTCMYIYIYLYIYLFICLFIYISCTHVQTAWMTRRAQG